MNDFFRILKEIRLKQKIIGEKDYKRIRNADEIAIWLYLIRVLTIEKIGNKKVKNINVINNKVFLKCQENSWVTKELYSF